MPWTKTPQDRKQDALVYGSPEYKRNRAIVRRRSGGRCEWTEGGHCGSRDRVQCDHKVPVSQGGTHALSNLWDLCKPHHDRKTAQEGGGWRKTRGRLAADPAPASRTQW